jgi:type IV pilus assembly protein PilE
MSCSSSRTGRVGPAVAGPHCRVAGFTLIELLITLAVIGILAVMAYPSFSDQLRKGRRAEAFTALAQVQQAQERWRANRAEYTTDLADLGLQATTPSGYYTISVAAAPAGGGTQPLATAYVAMAHGNEGTSQAADAQCRRLAVRLQGGNLTYAGCGACESFAAADFLADHACWPR